MLGKVWLAWLLVACNASPAREPAPREETSIANTTPAPGAVTTAAAAPRKPSDPGPANSRTAVEARPRLGRICDVTLESLKRLRGDDTLAHADVERAFVGVPSLVSKCCGSSAGRIAATFDIMPSGGVQNIELSGALREERPAECLRAALLMRSFSPRGSATVVRYRAAFAIEPGELRELPDIPPLR